MAGENFPPTFQDVPPDEPRVELKSGYITKNFRRDEFACKHCQRNEIKESFVRQLQVARDVLDMPMIITSGYRCPEHNQALVDAGSAVEESAHVKGIAADIRCGGADKRFKLIEALLEAGFSRIGIGFNFVHVDADESKPQESCWVYQGTNRIS